MKKIKFNTLISTFSLILFNQSVFSQEIFKEDFSAKTIPTGWAMFNRDSLIARGTDQDGNFNADMQKFTTDAWIFAEEGEAIGCALSPSQYNPAGQSNDWLVTKER